MDDKTARVSLIEIKRAYDHFFNKGTTLAKIKDAALGDKLFPSPIPSNGSIGVPGRSIAWKLFLLAHEPLETSPVHAHMLVEAIRASRQAYKALLLEKMKAPDGSYDADLMFPGTAGTSVKDWVRNGGSRDAGDASSSSGNAGMGGIGPSPYSVSSANLEFNNPLSLHNENPWNAWFASVELRKTILQDVERTFPDIAYFRRPDVQLQLTNILFLFSVQHPSIGYRQGMHELLAPLYHAVAYDAIMEEQEGITIIAEGALRELCSPLWVAADAWALFKAVMRGVSRWYEWQETPLSISKSTTSATSLPNGSGGRSSPLPTHVRFDVRDGQQGGLKPYVAPIVQTCNLIQGTLLRTTDPQLFSAIQGTGIEPQIYGIRWLRLLFTRELSMPDALRLWDGLFACDPTFDLAQWVCIAMLIRIRNDLIPADYSGQLTLLLRYPTPPNSENSIPHHAVLLLRQALALQMAPNPSTGASIMIENRTILDIPIEVPAPVPTPIRRGHLGRQQMASTPGREGGHGQGHSRLSSVPSMGLPEMIARGLLERGESLGINKTLMSAVTELKRNIPDLAASLVRPVHQAETAFPLEGERPPQERPPWEPRTRFEMERDISQLRTRDKQIGDSLGWIVDVLLQDEEETENRQRLKKERREAIESLAYIRDVLISDAMVLEDDRLVGEEEGLRRKAKIQRQETGTTTTVGPVSGGALESSPPKPESSKIVSPPAPLPVIDSGPKTTGNRRRSQGSMSGMSVSHSHTPPVPADAGAAAGGGPTLAPWNYTRSTFSGHTVLPSASLPRPPPPTSRSLRRTGDQTPTRGEGSGYSDPLGAMR
ncbi:RabGAP/TBC [Macrolepiota fuliginosa MF-IS2]|uniref:RabGAP/TBC n=1 Tax=Macrolepiota fuliginosa MF-IS2 TaxID=1400762 RepID=A0A9P5XKY6_9AGAR|nr:RabGAP/TBC [Macrolepiota fuliginosa MF-IS2]